MSEIGLFGEIPDPVIRRSTRTIDGPVAAGPSIDFTGPGPDVILLDYVFTLCANSWQRDEQMYWREQGRYEKWIEQEIYRPWLVDLCRAHPNVILITARSERHRVATMTRLQAVTGWSPAESYFNTRNVAPPQSKQFVLNDFLFPRLGRPDKVRYLALESNAQTRAMYARNGILAVSVTDDPNWTRFPTPPLS